MSLWGKNTVYNSIMERSRKDARMIWAVRPFCMGLNIARYGWGGGLRYGEVKKYEKQNIRRVCGKVSTKKDD